MQRVKKEKIREPSCMQQDFSGNIYSTTLNRITSQFVFLAIFAVLFFIGYPLAIAQEKCGEGSLQFAQGEAESYTFDTDVLQGILRQEGKSIGLFPVIYKEDSLEISVGKGFINHYRVFTLGKRYGHAARDWPSTAELRPDGSVEVFWPAMPDRPFELRGKYKWISPNTIDLITTVSAKAKLEAFEVFLASYASPIFVDSRVWSTIDQDGGRKEGFISADRKYGEWLVFPRDEQALEIIQDGRWDLEPSPLDWTVMPMYTKPITIRHDKNTEITVIMMTQQEDCFGIFTPYNEEKHYSNYMSLFGFDIEKGQSASAHSRMVVLKNPTESKILKVYDAFVNDKP